MTQDSTLHLYGVIEKFDTVDGHLIVTGIASTEDVDNAGEVVSADAMRKAIPSYLLSGTVREMHQPIAAGKPISAFVDEQGRTHLTAKIVDVGTIEKIKQGVLKGFSIGGKALAKAGKTITEILLKDISVVDVPCNSSCMFEIIKFDKPGDKCSDKGCKNHSESAVEKCGTCKSSMQKNMSEEAMKKMDSLAATVESLAKTVETLAKASPPQFLVDGKPVDIAKVLVSLGDLEKRAVETQKQVESNERTSIIAKMETQGRVAFNPASGVAYTRAEIDALPLDILKFAAANSPAIPLQARAIYKGEQDPKTIDPNLKGSDLVVKSWEREYGSLDAMNAKANSRGN